LKLTNIGCPLTIIEFCGSSFSWKEIPLSGKLREITYSYMVDYQYYIDWYEVSVIIHIAKPMKPAYDTIPFLTGTNILETDLQNSKKII
jgi:hypothetical protein